ncbi:MAG TPA: YceI family protein [Lamprocystis sp. (in: g-proteobacteria)]|nr:YceI family protein [Lamprocystis sp. (in: g-proteobacteria)]
MKRPALPAVGFALIASAMLSVPAWADWTLDPARSHLAFISIKAKDVAEIHTFNEVKGRIAPDGQANVSLMLDSVETLIPIRNERMREFLFQTTDYKEAVLSAKIDPALIKAMPTGAISTITAEGTLSLHGQTQPMTLLVQVAKVSDNTVMVASAKPVVIDAAKFGMTEGVEKLREIAGLAAISNAVPVSFVLTFVDGNN